MMNDWRGARFGRIGAMVMASMALGASAQQEAPILAPTVQATERTQRAPAEAFEPHHTAAGSALDAAGLAVAAAEIAPAATTAAANSTTAAVIDEADERGRRVARCQQFFRLPWGPMSDCRTAIVGSAVGGVLTVGAFQWWKRGFSSHMTRVNEGWFGRETYAGGVDKLSHVYTFYIGTRVLADTLQWGGASKGEALAISAAANAGTSYLIELFDGYSKKTYGFSREDLVADAVGILMGSAVVLWPELDRKFAYRMRYVPKGAGGSANFIDSYEGQTYFLSARFAGFMNLSPKNPLRYLELVFGYRGTGFKPRAGVPGVDYARHERRTYYGIGLNVEEILRGTLFAANERPTRVQAITEGVLTYVQLPGTVFAKTRAF
ncbi:MAG: DUF2279 domain-containing protein [Burkholderiales bacterium]|nr:DUF2279 domain-containing protein [Burkholderiales bacterium]